jgi:plasmid stabilization system protein ParE
MNKPILRIHTEAAEEAEAAKDWYFARSPDAAIGFLRELERALDYVVARPHACPKYLHRTRSYLLHRYPFILVYRLKGDTLYVVAIAHASRDPGYWRKRQFDV